MPDRPRLALCVPAPTAYSVPAMNTRVALLALAASLFVTLATPAHAAGDERVTLKDGSFYRGEILEKVVGDHVTIRLGTGEIKRIPWADVDPSAPEPKSATQPAASTRKGVRVHLTADSTGAELQRYRVSTTVDVVVATPNGSYVGQTDVDLYGPVCAAPCDVEVEPGGTYRIGAPSMVPTDGFQLRPGGDNVITASLSSNFHRSAGKTLTLYSIPVLLVGGLFYGLGANSEDTVACAGCANFHKSEMRIAGVLLGTGAVMLTAGIVLWATSGSSASINGNSVALNSSGTVRLGAAGVTF